MQDISDVGQQTYEGCREKKFNVNPLGGKLSSKPYAVNSCMVIKPQPVLWLVSPFSVHILSLLAKP